MKKIKSFRVEKIRFRAAILVKGFSMIEILLALVFMSFAFLPIYNLFRFGQRGAWSNEKEIEATNYAADLINFMREQRFSDVSSIFTKDWKVPPLEESQIQEKLKKLKPPQTPDGAKGFIRKMTIQRFQGKEVGGVFKGIFEKFKSIFWEIKYVPNFLVTVTVSYYKEGQSMGNDEIRLSTIVTP